MKIFLQRGVHIRNKQNTRVRLSDWQKSDTKGGGMGTHDSP